MVEKGKGFQIFGHILLAFLSICAVAPFILLIMSSLTDEQVLLTNGYSFFPAKFSTYAYEYLLTDSTAVIRGYGISFLITAVGTVCNLIFTTLYAYPLSRRDLPGRNVFAFYLFFTMLFSGGLVPSYIINTRYLHLNNTVWIFLLPSLASAYNVIILRTFILSTIPDSLFEAARIDGAGHFRVFISIVLPLFKAGLATIGLFNVVSRWNDWFTGMLYITANDSLIPLQTLLQKIQSSIDFLKRNAGVGSTPDGLQYLRTVPTQSLRMACTVIIVVPILAAYPFFQRYFVQGLTMGSIKE